MAEFKVYFLNTCRCGHFDYYHYIYRSIKGRNGQPLYGHCRHNLAYTSCECAAFFQDVNRSLVVQHEVPWPK